MNKQEPRYTVTINGKDAPPEEAMVMRNLSRFVAEQLVEASDETGLTVATMAPEEEEEEA
jgi:predicted metal-dependent TIM-barrel fold hydrolase